MASLTKDDELSSFDVPETARHAGGHTIYKIVLQVTPKELTRNSYQLVYWKRYNDIRKLYDILHRYHQAIFRPGKFPDFPDKTRFMERFDPAVIEQRREATKTFLNYALQHLYLRTHEAFLSFFEKGEKNVLPDVEVATLEPEKINSPTQPPPAMTPSLMPTVQAKESATEIKTDELLFTTAEEEQIQHAQHSFTNIIDDLSDLQFDQQQEINKEKDEFDFIQEQINEAASK